MLTEQNNVVFVNAGGILNWAETERLINVSHSKVVLNTPEHKVAESKQEKYGNRPEDGEIWA